MSTGNVNYNAVFGAEVKVACMKHLSSTIQVQLAGLLISRMVAPLHKFIGDGTTPEGEQWELATFTAALNTMRIVMRERDGVEFLNNAKVWL